MIHSPRFTLVQKKGSMGIPQSVADEKIVAIGWLLWKAFTGWI